MNEIQREVVASIRRLDSQHPEERTNALVALVKIGPPATWHLIQALTPSGPLARQEALRALCDLADPDAADTFIACLEDEDSTCRWLAAEGLAALGELGLARTLDLLLEYPPTDHVRRGTHHVLSHLEKNGFAEVVRPVLAAYASVHSQTDLPAAARRERIRLGDFPSSSVED